MRTTCSSSATSGQNATTSDGKLKQLISLARTKSSEQGLLRNTTAAFAISAHYSEAKHIIN
jgi:hypothetical protein